MSKGRCYRSVVVRSDATKTETFLLLLLFCLFWGVFCSFFENCTVGLWGEFTWKIVRLVAPDQPTAKASAFIKVLRLPDSHLMKCIWLAGP